MSRIFISYRREDTGMGVGRLADALRQHFAREQVFQDISSIDPGADFIEVLQKALGDCAAVLVVIGPKWLTVTGKQGQRRLDVPQDWVRQEIVEALGRPGLKIFPLLVDGAEMPAPEDLPDALQPLARRQAHELTLKHWTKDVDVLAAMLKRIPALAGSTDSGGGAHEPADAEAARAVEAQRRQAEAQAQQRTEQERERAESHARRRTEEKRQPEAADAARKDDEVRRRAEAATQTATAESQPSAGLSLPWKPLAGGVLAIAVIGYLAWPSGAEPPTAPTEPGPIPPVAAEAVKADPVPSIAPAAASPHSGVIVKDIRPPAARAAQANSTQPAPPAKTAPAPEAATGSFTGEMVPLPAGCFEMGSPLGEQGRDEDEHQHRVCVEAFAIGKTEVTQAQWQAVMGNNPSHWKCANCPVERVSWIDAVAFVAKLNTGTGLGYRLPTEAEWEYACRGGRAGERYCGGDTIESVAWYRDNSNGMHPVGKKPANGFGLRDMSGNIAEWTCSGYDKDYHGGERQCANNASTYVQRGGSWVMTPPGVRSAYRSWDKPNGRDEFTGFRLARTL